MTRPKLIVGLGVLCVLALGALPVHAAINVSIDENGNGALDGQALVSGVGVDNGPHLDGMANSTLLYWLPSGVDVVAGDLVLSDEGVDVSDPSDIIRFNAAAGGNPAYIAFYSRIGGGNLADTMIVGPDSLNPSDIYNNLVMHEEVGGGYVYTPDVGDPGYVTGGITYVIASDEGTIPEPATLIIWTLLGGLGVAVAHLRQRKAA